MTRGALLLLILAACAAEGGATTVNANPVRKVVQMLQAMQKKVTSEGETEAELFDKFMCYCKTGSGDLSKSIGDAETKIPQLSSELKDSEATLAETKEGLKQDQEDRSAAKAAIAEATGIRKKENSAFVGAKDEYVANIDAILKAVAALEKGTAGSFLQTRSASVLQKILNSRATQEMLEEDKQTLLSFLSGGGNPFSQGYAPQSGQIVGLLKQLGDSMATSLANIMIAEEKAVYTYGELMKAKTAEVNSLTEAIEAKTAKIGDLGVHIVQIKDDLDDTSQALNEDRSFLKELEKGCDTKAAEWEERKKTRAAELLALAETIKILNDDDALELFKKTLPAPGVGFVQMDVARVAMRKQALAAVQAARRTDRQGHVKLDLIMLSLSGRKVSFDKVIKMIDEMVALLGAEQTDDDDKKAYCEKSLDESEDDKKVLENTIGDLEKSIATTEESISTLAEEIAALLKGISDLDSQVKEATTTREEENAFYKKTMQEDAAAKDILKMAKNRLAQFYAPKMYVPPAKVERSAMGRISEEMSLEQRTDPGPPPSTWSAYATKSEEHGGVVAMLDLLIADLDKEMASMTTQEKDDQAEYEAFMAEAGDKRAADSKSTEQKEGEKADLEAALVKLQQDHKDTSKELYLKEMEIKDLHLECDWLIANFEMRKSARAGEVDSLKKAKAVLSGADYSLVQTAAARSLLRGSAQ